MKYFLFALLVIHGLIHILGFVKAFDLATVDQLVRPITRPAGILWLTCTVLFLAAAGMLLAGASWWWLPGLVALILSQALIIMSWSDARFGTIANLLLVLPLLAALMNTLPGSHVNRFTADVRERLRPVAATGTVTELDIARLPMPVQRYLRFTGAVGRPKVVNFRVSMTGTMRRSPGGDWLAINARQYSFLDDRARLFYISSALYGVPFDGYHAYIGEHATMQITVAHLLTVADARGEKMDRGETVTMFNDMCLMAPAALIDPSIGWELLDTLTVKATFSNAGNTISAILSFDPSGALKDFISHDRSRTNDGVMYLDHPWSTPVRAYHTFHGMNLAGEADAVWHAPEGAFTYARFTITDVEYNVADVR